MSKHNNSIPLEIPYGNLDSDCDTSRDASSSHSYISATSHAKATTSMNVSKKSSKTKSSITILDKTKVKSALELLIQYYNMKLNKKEVVTSLNITDWRKNHSKRDKTDTYLIEQYFDHEITVVSVPTILKTYLTQFEPDESKITLVNNILKSLSKPEKGQKQLSFAKPWTPLPKRNSLAGSQSNAQPKPNPKPNIPTNLSKQNNTVENDKNVARKPGVEKDTEIIAIQNNSVVKKDTEVVAVPIDTTVEKDIDIIVIPADTTVRKETTVETESQIVIKACNNTNDTAVNSDQEIKNDLHPAIKYTNLYQKSLSYRNHIRILETHLESNTTPKALDRNQFPNAILKHDSQLNDEIESIILDTQKQIMNTTITRLNGLVQELEKEMLSLQPVTEIEKYYIHLYVEKEVNVKKSVSWAKAEKRVIECKNPKPSYSSILKTSPPPSTKPNNTPQPLMSLGSICQIEPNTNNQKKEVSPKNIRTHNKNLRNYNNNYNNKNNNKNNNNYNKNNNKGHNNYNNNYNNYNNKGHNNYNNNNYNNNNLQPSNNNIHHYRTNIQPVMYQHHRINMQPVMFQNQIGQGRLSINSRNNTFLGTLPSKAFELMQTRQSRYQ